MRQNVFVVVALVLAVARTLNAENTAGTVSFGGALRIMPAAEAQDFTETALVKLTVREMLRRSATFAELARVVDSVPDVIVYIQTATLEQRGLRGRARFEVARSGVVIGQITLHRFRPTELEARISTIAHELAHAYEVVCLKRPVTTYDLREALAARATSYGRTRSAETPFASAVETVVRDEWFGEQLTPSQLDPLALRYGLTDCSSAGSSGGDAH
jgi:hypothetical protein